MHWSLRMHLGFQDWVVLLFQILLTQKMAMLALAVRMQLGLYMTGEICISSQACSVMMHVRYLSPTIDCAVVDKLEYTDFEVAFQLLCLKRSLMCRVDSNVLGSAERDLAHLGASAGNVAWKPTTADAGMNLLCWTVPTIKVHACIDRVYCIGYCKAAQNGLSVCKSCA